MNLLAVLSLEQTKTLDQMDWYGTVVPLIAMQLGDVGITPLMTCGELLALILELPADKRTLILAVSVPDKAANEAQVQEIKQESHRSMLVGLSGAFVIISFIALMVYIGYTDLEGTGGSEAKIQMIWGMVKEAYTILSSMQ